jgi:hypothetical protein
MKTDHRYFTCLNGALGALLLANLGLAPGAAWAHRPIEADGRAGPALPAWRDAPPIVSGVWVTFTNPFPGTKPGTALQLTDGTVLVHDTCTTDWYRLTPTHGGDDYAAGTWRKMATAPNGYSPQYFASQVLPDTRVLVNGGEYNGAGCPRADTTQGALYDPQANQWFDVPAPPGWTAIGDAASVLLPSGDEMLQEIKGSTMESIASVAPLPSHTVTWKATGAGKADSNGEEGWTPLANGEVLAADTHLNVGMPTPAEIYSQTTGKWTATGTSPVTLADPGSHEIGPAVRLPDGTVFQTGANPCGHTGCRGHTAIYHPSTKTWTAGPDFPVISGKDYDVSDGPAAVLPSGHVLIQASPAYGCNDSKGNPSPYCAPSHFFEYDGTGIPRVNEPASAPNMASFEGRMLVLPTGHVLWTNSRTTDVEVYEGNGGPKAAWRPVLSAIPATLTRSHARYTMSGSRFFGVSNGAAYGDDAQMVTNYPLLRFQSKVDGTFCFAITYGFTATSSLFDMPYPSPRPWVLPCTPGPAVAQVIVNGIASVGKNVTIN